MKEDRRSKHEIIRRLRLGDLQKFLRFRYGRTLPGDDAGRDDLHELLLPISLGPDGSTEKMKNAIEVWAPWMDSGEAMQLIDRVNRTPSYLRLPTARQLGERLPVTNQERERLNLQTIKPFDMSDEQLTELRKTRDRARKLLQRQAAGSKPRAEYLANSLTKQKPWESEGISRATWYRKRRETSASAVKLLNTPDTPVSLSNLHRPKRSQRQTDRIKPPQKRIQRRRRRRGRTCDGHRLTPRLPAPRTHLSHAESYALSAP